MLSPMSTPDPAIDPGPYFDDLSVGQVLDPAPAVTIGDGAYSGAGTVIRKDVPAGALAILQAPQRNVERWVAANRPGSAAAKAAARAQAEEGSANQPDAGSLD